MKPIRRVVTGNSPDGRSTILFDSEVAPVVTAKEGDRAQRLSLAELWATTESPASNASSEDAARTVYSLLPAANGTLLRTVEILPEPPGSARPGLGSDSHPGFHRTDTIDYMFVVSGEIYAMVEDGEVLLRAGDVLVQRGTNHAWSNRSQAPCLMVAVMIDAQPA